LLGLPRIADVGYIVAKMSSNPDLGHLEKADVIGAPVIEAGGFGVGVSGHALGTSMRPPLVR